jgi:hypothetical protein
LSGKMETALNSNPCHAKDGGNKPDGAKTKKVKTKQNTSASQTMETMMMRSSERRLILVVVAGGIGLPQVFQADVHHFHVVAIGAWIPEHPRDGGHAKSIKTLEMSPTKIASHPPR